MKPLEVVQTTKLVGVTLTSDLKFHEHVKIIVKKANKKIWMLRRLKEFDFTKKDLLEIYISQIRSTLEYNVPAWNPSLTNDDITDIERVKNTALKIILGEDYNDYESCLKLNQLKTLEERRKDLCLRFAQKCTQNKNHQALFKLNENRNLHHPTKYQIPFCKHDRYRNSPIPYLINLLNREES